MPLYEYQCPWCEAKQTELRCIVARDKGPVCQKCKGWQVATMQRILSPTPGVVKNPAVPKGTK